MNQKELDFTEDEIRVEVWRHKNRNEGVVLDDPVRLTHIPTGLIAVGEGRGSQIQNKQMAMSLLKKMLADYREQKEK
ncbi:MAG: peptide chain release factor-like protein [Acidobacteria bacterium]|nr:peptide chain release factor-like protein [Acidobacteriota bacterium]